MTMKIIFDDEYENVDKDISTMKKYDKNKYCVFIDGAGYNRELRIIDAHWHEWLEIIYIIDGETSINTPKGSLLLKKGDFAVVGMQLLHEIISHLGNYRFQCIQINMGFILQNMAPTLLNDVVFKVKNVEEFKCHFSNIVRLMKRDDIISQLEYKAHIINLLAQCIKESNVNIEKNDYEVNDIFSDMLFYISTHYQENISLKELSNKFHYTTQHISLLFKKMLDTTYYTYLTKIRLDHAKFLLMTTNKRIIDIALECGFSNEHVLINQFKKVYGQTPLQYRKDNMIK